MKCRSVLALLALLQPSCQALVGIEDTRLPDMGPPDAAVSPVAHVPFEASAPGAADLIIDVATIDTTRRTIAAQSTMLDVDFSLSLQEPWREAEDGGEIPPLAVLRVRNFTLQRGGAVRVIGEFPLVIIADGPVTIEGILDASAQGQSPGAGGAAPGQGLGAGASGRHMGPLDSGGGGGGHAAQGGRGGDAHCQGAECAVARGGAGGPGYGGQSLPILRGGSGGGGNPCYATRPGPSTAGGAGGGALQIYSNTSIFISETGGIHVGGSGGAGGTVALIACGSFLVRDFAGAGGGSGGAVFLQAPRIINAGVVAANGGGGGGSAGDGGGGSGDDALLDASPAPGGVSGGGTRGAAGGAGGALDASAEPGGDAPSLADNDGNSGGGGGAAGRIVIVSDEVDLGGGVISPAPHIVSESPVN